MTGYIVQITDPHYSAGMAGGVAVPVPDGGAFALYTTEGDLIAQAWKTESGNYVSDGDFVYSTWTAALADATGGELTAAEVAEADTMEV
jgi:hypothetical protein